MAEIISGLIYVNALPNNLAADSHLYIHNVKLIALANTMKFSKPP